ncbi:MAG: class B sortase, partial [Oscillospiraceae bacterium]|nr:class B sortase [Oscillospiraceae bacterium]
KIQKMKAAREQGLDEEEGRELEGEWNDTFPEDPEVPADEEPPELAAMIAETPVKKASRKKKKRSSLFPQRGDSAFEVIRKTVFLMSMTVFTVCMFLIGEYFWTNYLNKLNNEKKADMYDPDNVQVETQMATDDLGEPYEAFILLDNARRMLEINKDVVGFISIKNTPINYNVLQYQEKNHPEEEYGADVIGNTYYLNKNMDLQPEKAGSIFMDYRNYFDYIDDVTDRRIYANSTNIIIYGHNMHDYNMFGSLKKYVNEANYYDEHPIVELNSNYRTYKYKIFGMIIVDVEDTTDTAFDYWNVLNFQTEEDFYNYVNEIKRRTTRLTDVDVTYGDQLLTLSTCNSTFSDGRLVVFGRLLRDGESEEVGPSTPNPNIKWPNSYYKWRKNTYDPNAELYHTADHVSRETL